MRKRALVAGGVKSVANLYTCPSEAESFIGFIKPSPQGQSKIPLSGSQNQMALPLIFVPKNIKSKHQITNKFQIPISNDQNLTGQDIF
jgi:hypothetical protein